MGASEASLTNIFYLSSPRAIGGNLCFWVQMSSCTFLYETFIENQKMQVLQVYRSYIPFKLDNFVGYHQNITVAILERHLFDEYVFWGCKGDNAYQKYCEWW